MAEFNCQCGKVLENSKDGDMLYIFDEQEILAACQQMPELTLTDFLANWRRWAIRRCPRAWWMKRNSASSAAFRMLKIPSIRRL